VSAPIVTVPRSTAKVVLGERQERFGLGWGRTVAVHGSGVYRVVVERGKPVRIPYKPRGANRGFKWSGAVYTEAGRCIWHGEVSGSIGARGLLSAAGVLT